MGEKVGGAQYSEGGEGRSSVLASDAVGGAQVQ